MGRLRNAALLLRAERASEIEKVLQTTSAAVAAVRSCKALRPVLSILVSLGNRLNAGTLRGQADGFAIADLGKTCVTKDNTNAISLLE